MLEWMLVIAAVGSHEVVWPDAGRYPTQESCMEAAQSIATVAPGDRYGVCRPVSKPT